MSIDVYKGYFKSVSSATLVRKDGKEINKVFGFELDQSDKSLFATIPTTV
jgi:hypothetical protein